MRCTSPASVAVAAGLSLAACLARAGIFDDPKNLKVLPKDISAQALRQTMRGFAFDLGVGCESCHVGEAGAPIETFDFAADDKRMKLAARLMLRMVADINDRQLSKLDRDDGEAVRVQCGTCHRGQSKPVTMAEALEKAYREGGSVAAVAHYRALKSDFFGAGGFDFTERPRLEFARTLAAKKDVDGAIGFLRELKAEYGAGFQTDLTLADLHLAAGDREAALAHFRSAHAAAPTAHQPLIGQRIAGVTGVGAGDAVTVIESSVLTPDGIRLYYRVAGSGAQTIIAPFALYHGAALDRLARNRRIVTYDPRGRGRSDAVPLERLSLDFLLNDLDTVRQAVGADKVTLLGWSGGGMEGFAYALRHPGRVERIIQLAPVAARFDPYGMQMMEDRARRTDPAAAESLRARIAGGEFAGDTAAQCRERARISNPAMLADPAHPPAVPDVCVHRNEHDDLIGPYFGRLFEFIDAYDYRERLAEVTVPRLVIHGAADNTPLAGNREWVAGQPNARILVIEGAGHWPHYERPEETLAAIEMFLDGRWPAGAQAVP